MPYNINRYNGALVATVEDGTVDNTLDIKLIGRNYAGYGEVQNENFVHLLENFAGTSEPPKKVSGQIWFDSTNKKLKFYDGTKFRTTGGAEIGISQPSGLTTGDFWFNTQTNQLYAWTNNNSFVLVGPQAVESAGTTELKSVSVTDIGGTTHPIVRAIINNKTVFIISNSEFQIPDNTIEGFKLIKKGITLVDTIKTNTSDPDYGVTSSEYRFWGTTGSSLKLLDNTGKSYTPDDFIKAANPNFIDLVSFSNNGIKFGGIQGKVKLYIDNNNPTLESELDNASIVFKTKVGGDAILKTPMILNGNDILPGSTVTSLGKNSPTQKFASVYAIDFYGSLRGTADQSDKVNSGGTYVSGSINATANTLATRDNLGRITATQFVGPATTAISLQGGVAGSIPFQQAPGTTTFINIGNANEVLTVDAGGQLDWQPITNLVNAGNATKIQVSTANITNQDFYVTFTSGTSGFQDLNVDANALTYNPNTNTLVTENFKGKASSAVYADLAEKYLADKEYQEGTVLVVGGDKEVTASSYGQRAIGVVSMKPAYLMNTELEGGTAVALKGRVPVMVVGPVNKGNKLVAGDNGTAQAILTTSPDVFAIALESSKNHGVKIIECVIL